MTLENIVKDAIKEAVSATIVADVRDIVAKETRRALREREDELTAFIRDAVASAIGELLSDPH